MTLNRIDIEWFRGAADRVSLDLGGKSTVVYGTNGSGKSSFVDALEYILNDGRIGHLTHEYSGKKQEKGVLNTHTPTLKPTSASLGLTSGDTVVVNIKPNGTFTRTGNGYATVRQWDYRRVVLRQDEVAAFISSPKGAKYSALLPLLGLAPLEHAAENIRQVAKHLERTSEFSSKKALVASAAERARRRLGTTLSVTEILARIGETYMPGVVMVDDADACEQLSAAITRRIKALSADAQQHIAISALGRTRIEDSISEVRVAASALAETATTLVEERLAMLEGALRVLAADGGEPNVSCPACGREIATKELEAHLHAEKDKLAHTREALNEYKQTVNALSDDFAALKAALRAPAVIAWGQKLDAGIHARALAYFSGRDPASLRATCDEDELRMIGTEVLPLVMAARAHASTPPPEADQLVNDHDAVATALALIKSADDTRLVTTAERLLGWLGAIEQAIRDLIRTRSDAVIEEISGDIQRMWSILHPNEAIENVRLRHPDEADKAIDIELSFHGVALKSPRLTLSEGYRNSLGLCVFLSMAKRSDCNIPVVLDDVVVSLDRNHRGMIVDLFEKEFGDRQLLVLTHDREWYVELRQRLDQKVWNFRALRPYGAPADGIAWSTKSSTFGDARAFLATAPDVAGNTVRKIMDIELASRAEKLQLKMPYLHGYKNDHRMAHDFLEALVSASKRAFQTRKDTMYVPAEEAVRLLGEADRLLVAWGNRASHTFDVVRPEAERLIDECERALSAFDCVACEKPVYKFDDSAGIQQCSCGALRWRYAKLS
jgi:energy-coupling factor transporter ATP-binding protein EcfA2